MFFEDWGRHNYVSVKRSRTERLLLYKSYDERQKKRRKRRKHSSEKEIENGNDKKQKNGTIKVRGTDWNLRRFDAFYLLTCN